MAKTKAELLDEAKELNLDVSESNTNAEIQEAIDQKQAEQSEGEDTPTVTTPEGEQELADEPNGDPTDKQENRTENTSTEQEQDPTSLTPSAGEETDWQSSEDLDEGETRADAIQSAHESAQANHDAVQTEEGEEAPTAAELDGTAELESEGTSRHDAIRQGREAARANVERERADNDQAGE